MPCMDFEPLLTTDETFKTDNVAARQAAIHIHPLGCQA